ncbi:3-hydroxyacyl-CoA dehydrogenase family protein [Peribacillus cavernae]|uniref:3-hydroxyacyl-CoA dehydrogenase family protein n=1 Tax=Peribacillus cavernae TaxID=1674310 RepID=A0A3S0VJV3_9BACI|nr:3-hydroxyacyl-CoA dehydrogenase family protein [Peribacillus cavernae]MDQ0219445.1 3-hydroxybutyryl-CoA dehydrogenase [Peribacillus cavernae]RUQ27132.1 3-hydroxyacyl-CoA dehydrogenase family protein [Peribacillus cavernae]
MEPKKVGVVGCGTMGAGIAICMLQSGMDTVVCETSAENLENGLNRISAFFEGSVKRGKMTPQQKQERLNLIQETTDLQDLVDCDVIVEAIFEDVRIKNNLFRELNTICNHNTIFVSNTSTLSITSIASGCGRQDRVIGIHFCNPAPLMKLVEISHGLETSDDTYNKAVEFSEYLKKKVVTTKDTPGFILNLLLVPFENDCIRALEQGIATVEDIDLVLKHGLGYPMGTFELLDNVGLDIHYAVSMSLYNELKDKRFAPPPLVKKMIDAGHLGKKTGKGFYEYNKTGMFGAV